MKLNLLLESLTMLTDKMNALSDKEWKEHDRENAIIHDNQAMVYATIKAMILDESFLVEVYNSLKEDKI